MTKTAGENGRKTTKKLVADEDQTGDNIFDVKQTYTKVEEVLPGMLKLDANITEKGKYFMSWV